MLVEIAIGDAYGAGFEYAPADFVACYNDLSGYVRYPGHGAAPGTYTDDTQLSLALAEAIVEGEPWTPDRLAERFVRTFHRDPRKGYARGFQRFLEGVDSGVAFLAGIRPHSDKSGAAMRAASVGVFADVEEVLARSRVQAALTHDTPSGVASAQAAALMVHYFLYRRGPKAELGRFLEAHVDGKWASRWRGKVGAKGWMSVRAAVTAIEASDSLSEVLYRCVAFTGDTDTVAAIAMGAAAHSDGITSDLPERLYTDLENGDYGRDYLKRIDDALLARLAS